MSIFPIFGRTYKTISQNVIPVHAYMKSCTIAQENEKNMKTFKTVLPSLASLLSWSFDLPTIKR